jgi:hypothetical protein
MPGDIYDFIRTADIYLPRIVRDGTTEALGALNTVSIDELSDAVLVDGTITDFTHVRSKGIRHAVSLAMLFAYRITAASEQATDPHKWLETYLAALGRLGFRMSEVSEIKNHVATTNLLVHNAIIPFLEVALGGAAAGPAILALMNQLSEMDKDKPWITLLHREIHRFNVQELHFATVAETEVETQIRNVVARFDISTGTTQFLFFKVTQNTATFQSETRTMTGNNALIIDMAPELHARLREAIQDYIWNAKIG